VWCSWEVHERVARGGHGLPKASLGTAIDALPYYAQLQGVAACRAGGRWPSSTPLETPCCTPLNIQYESSITAQVGGSDFSPLDNAKYVEICLVY
jgi:hypothetical protein